MDSRDIEGAGCDADLEARLYAEIHYSNETYPDHMSNPIPPLIHQDAFSNPSNNMIPPMPAQYSTLLPQCNPPANAHGYTAPHNQWAIDPRPNHNPNNPTMYPENHQTFGLNTNQNNPSYHPTMNYSANTGMFSKRPRALLDIPLNPQYNYPSYQNASMPPPSARYNSNRGRGRNNHTSNMQPPYSANVPPRNSRFNDTNRRDKRCETITKNKPESTATHTTSKDTTKDNPRNNSSNKEPSTSTLSTVTTDKSPTNSDKTAPNPSRLPEVNADSTSKYNVAAKTNQQPRIKPSTSKKSDEVSSDSDESIFEVPVPPKPAPLLINLNDSGDELSSSDEEQSPVIMGNKSSESQPPPPGVDDFADSSSQVVSSILPTSSRSNELSGNNSTHETRMDINNEELSNDIDTIPSNIIINCTQVTTGVTTLADIKRLRESTVTSTNNLMSDEDSMTESEAMKWGQIEGQMTGNNDGENALIQFPIQNPTNSVDKTIGNATGVDKTVVGSTSESTSRQVDDVFRGESDSLNLERGVSRKRSRLSDSGLESGEKSNDNGSKRRKSTKEMSFEEYVFQPMPKQLEQFYNEPRGGAALLDVHKIQSRMPNNPNRWAILDADKGNNFRSREKRKICATCQRTGHTRDKCPTGRPVPKCHMCGEVGHYEPRCPHSMCLTCGTKYSSYRKTCENCRNIQCNTCKSQGHTNENCPDLWRRYHQTTPPNAGVSSSRDKGTHKSSSPSSSSSNTCYTSYKDKSKSPARKLNHKRSRSRSLKSKSRHRRCSRRRNNSSRKSRSHSPKSKSRERRRSRHRNNSFRKSRSFSPKSKSRDRRRSRHRNNSSEKLRSCSPKSSRHRRNSNDKNNSPKTSRSRSPKSKSSKKHHRSNKRNHSSHKSKREKTPSRSPESKSSKDRSTNSKLYNPMNKSNRKKSPTLSIQFKTSKDCLIKSDKIIPPIKINHEKSPIKNEIIDEIKSATVKTEIIDEIKSETVKTEIDSIAISTSSSSFTSSATPLPLNGHIFYHWKCPSLWPSNLVSSYTRLNDIEGSKIDGLIAGNVYPAFITELDDISPFELIMGYHNGFAQMFLQTYSDEVLELLKKLLIMWLIRDDDEKSLMIGSSSLPINRQRLLNALNERETIARTQWSTSDLNIMSEHMDKLEMRKNIIADIHKSYPVLKPPDVQLSLDKVQATTYDLKWRIVLCLYYCGWIEGAKKVIDDYQKVLMEVEKGKRNMEIPVPMYLKILIFCNEVFTPHTSKHIIDGANKCIKLTDKQRNYEKKVWMAFNKNKLIMQTLNKLMFEYEVCKQFKRMNNTQLIKKFGEIESIMNDCPDNEKYMKSLESYRELFFDDGTIQQLTVIVGYFSSLLRKKLPLSEEWRRKKVLKIRQELEEMRQLDKLSESGSKTSFNELMDTSSDSDIIEVPVEKKKIEELTISDNENDNETINNNSTVSTSISAAASTHISADTPANNDDDDDDYDDSEFIRALKKIMQTSTNDVNNKINSTNKTPHGELSINSDDDDEEKILLESLNMLEELIDDPDFQ